MGARATLASALGAPEGLGCRTPGWRSAVQTGSTWKGGRVLQSLLTRPQTSRRAGGCADN